MTTSGLSSPTPTNLNLWNGRCLARPTNDYSYFDNCIHGPTLGHSEVVHHCRTISRWLPRTMTLSLTSSFSILLAAYVSIRRAPFGTTLVSLGIRWFVYLTRDLSQCGGRVIARFKMFKMVGVRCFCFSRVCGVRVYVFTSVCVWRQAFFFLSCVWRQALFLSFARRQAFVSLVCGASVFFVFFRVRGVG